MPSAGKQFETQIKHSLQVYEASKQLIFSKNEAIGGRFHRLPRLLPDFFVFNHRAKFILLEAKTCGLKTLFPFKNIKAHQINCMRKVWRWGASAYFLIKWTADDVCYAVSINEFIRYRKKTGRSSFKKEWVELNGRLIHKAQYKGFTNTGKPKKIKGWELENLLGIE